MYDSRRTDIEVLIVECICFLTSSSLSEVCPPPAPVTPYVAVAERYTAAEAGAAPRPQQVTHRYKQAGDSATGTLLISSYSP